MDEAELLSVIVAVLDSMLYCMQSVSILLLVFIALLFQQCK